MKGSTFLFAVGFVIVFMTFASAYETYGIGDSELEAGYTQDMSPGDRINFRIGDNDAHVSVLSVMNNYAQMGIFAHDRQIFYTTEYDDAGIFFPV